MIKRELIKKEIIYLIEALFLGSIIGLLVGLYQLGLRSILALATSLYISKETISILTNAIIIILLSLINYLIISTFPNLSGSGLPLISKIIEKKESANKLDYKDLPFLIINSYISTFSLFTLGSEGPSIFIATKSARLINHCFNDEENIDNIALASGAGFGSAFLSPLSGFIYSFEEGLHKFKLKLVLRGIIVSFSSFFICYLINNNHLLDFKNVNLINNNLSILYIVLIINLLIAFFFKKLVILIRKFFNKHQKKILIKYRSFFYFLIFFILSYFMLDYLGNGINLINNLINIDSFLIVFLLLLFRLIVLSMLANGKVSGGIVIPLMAIGAINGKISYMIFTNFSKIDPNFEMMIIFISMLLYFALITSSPLTTITLFLSSLFYFSFKYQSFSIQDIFISPSTYLIILLFIMGSFIFKYLFKEKNIYEDFNLIDELISN